MKFNFSLLVVLFFSPLLSAGQVEIKVMSFNIRLDVKSDGVNQWSNRKEKVAGLMNYYEADFIGGQEVQHHQLQYLKENMPAYDHIGVARDDGKEDGEYSCIFYRKEKFIPEIQNTFWLSPSPDSVSFGWDAACRRVCSYGLFKDKVSKQKFWVLNTHFDHIGKTARLESAKLIVAKIKELNEKNYLVILMGDFNSRPDDAPSKYILANLRNASDISLVNYGGSDTWNGFKFTEKPAGCIDYIFVGNDRRLTVSKFATITDSYEMKYPSDHFPIMATLTITK